MTASGHEINAGDRVTASGHHDLPGELWNEYADDVISETGIDPRIETSLPENESARVESGSGQKTATDLDATAHGKRATATMTAFDALDREWEEERERERQPWSRELLDCERALLSFRAPRSEDREPREDNTRERSSEISLNSPRRRVCSEEWGETAEEAERAREVRCDRATPPSPAPEGAGEAEARSLVTDDSPETLPPLSLDRDPAREEEAPRDTTPGAPQDPSLFPCPPEGQEREEEEVPGCETPEGVSVRGEASGAGGTEPEGREGFLRSL